MKVQENGQRDMGYRITKRRTELGMSQEGLAELAGMSRVSIVRIENGEQIDIPRLILFGDNLKTNIAPRRNDAAHGGNLITHQDACIDKQNVYNISANSYRGLILELFGIVFPNL